MACAWDAPDSPASSGALFVLVVLADHGSDHSGEDWGAFPSVERICRRTRFSRATVERHLAALHDDGWISRRRRVRPDGRLGVYDYVIHRHADVRGELRADRRLEKQRAETVTCDGVEASGHAANCSMEPCVNLGPAMLQIGAEPCLKLQHQEPLIEPSSEPSLGAREPGDEGFEEAFGLWPLRGQRRTNLPEARAAFALAAGEIGGREMVSRVRRCVEDGGLEAGDFGAPGWHRWLSEERWRVWAEASLPEAAPSLNWPGTGASGVPPELRDAVSTEALLGERFAMAYLDRAVWIAPNGLRPATAYAFDKLQREAGHVLRRFAVDLIQPNPRGIS